MTEVNDADTTERHPLSFPGIPVATGTIYQDGTDDPLIVKEIDVVLIGEDGRRITVTISVSEGEVFKCPKTLSRRP